MAAPTVERVGASRSVTVRPQRRRPRRAPEHAAWLAPLLALVTVFFLWPLLNVVRLAFTNSTLLRDQYSYTLKTFGQTLTDPVLPSVLGVTAVFVAASVAGQLALGLLIALIMQRAGARRLRGAALVRSVVLSAWVVPGILIGVIWQIVL